MGFVDDPNTEHLFNKYHLSVFLKGNAKGTYSRNSDNSMGDLFAEVSFSSLFHLDQDHGWDLFSGKNLVSISSVNLDLWLGILFDDFEGKVLDVMLQKMRQNLLGLEHIRDDELTNELTCTDASVHSRPMRRLASKTVFSGLVVSWFLAASPISRSPS